jgi:hypothetical protein
MADREHEHDRLQRGDHFSYEFFPGASSGTASEATLYGVRCTDRYKSVDAQWYRACGVRLLPIVVVKVDDGAIGMRVFFSSDPNRWAIEVCFRNLKP